MGSFVEDAARLERASGALSASVARLAPAGRRHPIILTTHLRLVSDQLRMSDKKGRTPRNMHRHIPMSGPAVKSHTWRDSPETQIKREITIEPQETDRLRDLLERLEEFIRNVLQKWHPGSTVFLLTSRKIEIAEYACEP